MKLRSAINLSILSVCFYVGSVQQSHAHRVGHGMYDTITVYAEILPNGDTIPLSYLPDLFVYAQLTGQWKEYYKEWKRLRNAVYVTYPYAVEAARVVNDINKSLVNVDNRRERKKIISAREKELRTVFSDKVKNLSVYQGRVLMKLINRETGNNCYEIIQEYKGTIPAGIYQGIAFLFSSSLKQPYSPMLSKTDKFIEIITRDLEIKYGYYNYTGNYR